MPLRICSEPTCPEPATQRGRCTLHARQRSREYQSPFKHIYASKRWQITRRKKLTLNPLCECDDPNCFDIATDVDHITPIAEGGDPWAMSNLRALAHACHSRVTRAAQLR